MDIYHTGREDKEDDHKFVNERLLEVAIPEPEEGRIITLEDCLETYFNNRIEVKRYLQRQNTMASMRSTTDEFSDKDTEKNETIHIETAEVDAPMTPIVASPVAMEASATLPPVRPNLEGRRRADSIFGQRYLRQPPESGKFDEKKHVEDMLDNSSGGRPRSASLLKKEILMPAWQFFSLIRKSSCSYSVPSLTTPAAWYTDNVPRSDAQVAAHFSAKRPILGICLKRYTMNANGTPRRLNTYIDIPLDIGLPHFISDERLKEAGPLFGNFKLVLQSVVCHRGVSVDSGHYIALVRANARERPSTSYSESEDEGDKWLRFDDLSSQRVTEIDIEQTLREESPYLLFYQVQPIDEELASRGDPPTYAEAQSRIPSVDPSRETLSSLPSTTATDVDTTVDWEKTSVPDGHTEPNRTDEAASRNSISSNQRSSLAIEDAEGSVRGRTQPNTPADEKTSFLSVSRRGSRIWMSGNGRSRPGSPSAENRLSITLSRLTGRASNSKLLTQENATTGDEPTIVIEKATNGEDSAKVPSPIKDKKESGISRSKSKKEKKDRLRSKSREPGVVLEKGKSKGKNRPDRECIVM